MGNEHVRFLRNRLLNDRICCIQRQINPTDFFSLLPACSPTLSNPRAALLGYVPSIIAIMSLHCIILQSFPDADKLLFEFCLSLCDMFPSLMIQFSRISALTVLLSLNTAPVWGGASPKVISVSKLGFIPLLSFAFL